MTKLPAKSEIEQLPKRAVIALAVRTVARIQLLYQLFGPDNDLALYIRSIDNVFRLREVSAASAASDDAYDARNHAYDLCAYPAEDVAYAAACVANTVDAGRNKVIAIDAALDAIETSNSVYACPAIIYSDFQILLGQSKAEGWTDETSVDHWKSLGSLWPEDEPEWFAKECVWQTKILGYAPYCAHEGK